MVEMLNPELLPAQRSDLPQESSVHDVRRSCVGTLLACLFSSSSLDAEHRVKPGDVRAVRPPGSMEIVSRVREKSRSHVRFTFAVIYPPQSPTHQLCHSPIHRPTHPSLPDYPSHQSTNPLARPLATIAKALGNRCQGSWQSMQRALAMIAKALDNGCQGP